MDISGRLAPFKAAPAALASHMHGPLLTQVLGTAPQVKLTSSDSQMFEVDEEVANESVTIKNMIEGECSRAQSALTLPRLRV